MFSDLLAIALIYFKNKLATLFVDFLETITVTCSHVAERSLSRAFTAAIQKKRSAWKGFCPGSRNFNTMALAIHSRKENQSITVPNNGTGFRLSFYFEEICGGAVLFGRHCDETILSHLLQLSYLRRLHRLNFHYSK